MGRYNKMPFVIWAVENLFSVAETLHSGVQKIVGKADADKLIFSAEHGENTLRVGSHVDFVVGSSSVPRLIDDLNSLHTVKAVGHHVSFFAVICQQIVVAVVDNQLVRAADVVFPASSGYLSGAVIQGVFQILKADLPLGFDCLIDLQHGSHDVLVAGFVAAYQIDLIVQFFNLAFAAQVFNGGQQMFFLALGDEFGGTDTFSQKPQFFKVVGTAANLVTAFAGVVDDFVVQTVTIINFSSRVDGKKLIQSVNVAGDGMAVCGNAVFPQMFLDGLGAGSVVIVCVFQKILPHQQGFELLVGAFAALVAIWYW